MRLAITGATGFIGRNLAEHLLKDGHTVTALGRSQQTGSELSEQGIIFKTADIHEPKETLRALEPVDCLIHCAGRAGDWGDYNDFHLTNVVGTRHVIEACRKHGIKRIIFIGTPNIYYSGRDRFNIKESEPLPAKTFTHYAATKLIACQELMQFSKEGHLVISLRPRAVYGPYDQTIMPRILAMAEGDRFPLINNGQALTDITYIGNLVDAVRLSLEAPDDSWNQVYNISNGEPVSIYNWFAEALKVFDRPFRPKNVPERVANLAAGLNELKANLNIGSGKPQLTRFSVGYMAKSMTMSIDKARRMLKYEPKVGNREGFELYRAWLNERELKAAQA